MFLRRLVRRRMVRTALLGTAAVMTARVVRNRRRRRFDPTRPNLDWGTTDLTIDQK